MRKLLTPPAAATGIAALGCALYIPFLGNPMVFDDLPFFSSGGFAYFATTPFGLDLRLLPYFSLTFPQVLWGKFPPWNHAEIHRVLSLAFHIACALALYRLIHDLLRAPAGPLGQVQPHEAAQHAALLGLIGAVFFVVHPAAVYGAAYLMQRTILLATLFSLLSLVFFVRGLVRGRHGYAVVAALFYTLAVFSKEHSVLLPAAALMTAPLATFDRRFAFKYVAIYLTGCLPAAVAVVALVHWVVGKAYEPGFEVLVAEMEGVPLLETAGGVWLVSAVTQAGLFFRYLVAWVIPHTGMMSIDVRIDFAQTWTPLWIVLKVGAFGAFGALGLFLVWRRGRAGLIGCGMLYAWILFAVELSSVRFQEPFVLYRSYLWAPGIILAVVGLLSLLPWKAMVATLAIVPVLLYQGHDRLQSFASPLALWTDAAAKLPAGPVPFGSRVLFGMAREQLYAGQLEAAARTADRCIAQYPKSWHCNFSRGAVHTEIGNYAQAVAFLDRALAAEPKSGLAHTHRGIALERLGRVDEARAAYRRASELGFLGGDYRLGMLDESGDGKPRVLYDASRALRRQEEAKAREGSR